MWFEKTKIGYKNGQDEKKLILLYKISSNLIT